MELNKEEVIKRVKGFAEKYRTDATSLVVCGGAALTVYGIRDHAKDIDLQVPSFLMYHLRGWAHKAVMLSNGRTVEVRSQNGFDVGNLNQRYFSSQVDQESGLRLQSLTSIYLLKTGLANPRPIDLQDIEALRKTLKVKVAT